MNRRGFLTRSGLALGALIVGDEMLEALDRLTHRKLFALGAIPGPYGVIHIRRDKFSPWVEHERAPYVDFGVTFRKPIPPEYGEGRCSFVVPTTMPATNVSFYLDPAALSPAV